MSGSDNLLSVTSQIKEKGRALFYTQGFSMLPMLKEGRDISVLVPVNRELKRGDVVLFVRKKRDNQLVLHRIVKRHGDGFIIRGDNTYFNEPVANGDILALLEGFFRKGKYFDCQKSKRYRAYVFLRLFFFPLRKFVRRTLRIAAAKIKNNVFHLNNLHLDDILGIKR